jgi:hypothetical protein
VACKKKRKREIQETQTHNPHQSAGKRLWKNAIRKRRQNTKKKHMPSPTVIESGAVGFIHHVFCLWSH